MLLPILCLGAVSFVIAWIATAVMIRVAPRFGLVDKPGGRKIHERPKPLGGGVAMFVGFALPMIVGLGLVQFMDVSFAQHWITHPDFAALVRGGREQTDLAIWLLAA